MADTPIEGSGADDKSAEDAPKTDYVVTGDETQIEKAEREKDEAEAKKSEKADKKADEDEDDEADEDLDDDDAEDDEDADAADDDEQDDDDDDEDQSEDEEESDTGRKKRRGGFQKKIDRLETEIANLQGQLQDNSNNFRKVDPFAAEPKRQNFRTDQDFNDAHTDWRDDQREASRQAEAKKANFQQSQGKKVEIYEAKTIELRKNEDYAKAVDSYDGPLTIGMQQGLIDSDYGPEVAFELAKNPEIGRKMAGMTMLQINKEIARLEVKIERKQAKTKSRKSTSKKTKSSAPRPIEPVKGTTKVKVDADSEPYEDYLKKRQKRRGS